MKAITKYKYGGPEVLSFEEVEKPKVEAGHLLVKVKATSANPADWHVMRGEPLFARLSFGVIRPKKKILGADFAGIVEEVGDGVRIFKVGDHVFGEFLEGGAFADYISVPEQVCGHMPDKVSFEEMASMPVAGLTALQAIVTHGKLKEGESVLINGASGGVGHFAVQIAKTIGATVTAVCSERNKEFVKSVGADYVIAYDKEDIHSHATEYDLVLDNNGNLDFSDFKRMGKRGVLVGFTTLGQMASVMLRKSFGKFPLVSFTAKPNKEDLETLAGFIREGKVKPYIEKIFAAAETADAIAYIEAMRTRGKVVMVWE